MALEDILNKIEQKSRSDIANIEKDAKEKCKAINKETDKLARELRDKNRHAAQLKSKKLKEHMLQEARLASAKEILKTKSDILESIFDEALGKLEKLPPEKYKNWLEKTILLAVESGENEIILPKDFAKNENIDEFIKKMNAILKKGATIKLSKETDKISGGFILKIPKKEIDFSFKSLLEEKKNLLRVRIGKSLFENAAA
jgi:V/A-type H+-transporting ATPase subunit E